MEGIGKYKVSDLVKVTGVARTTINDWLQRYGQYLTFEIQGKRKLYTDHAVAVLKEIADLRNAGQNSFEIDNYLAARHPVRAEIAEEPRLETLSEDDEENEESSPPVNSDQEFAVIATKQTDEIARMIGEQLRQLNARLETIEASEMKARRANFYWAATFLIVIILFVAAGIGAFRIYDSRNRDYQELMRQQSQTAMDLQKQNQAFLSKQKEIQDLTMTLDRNSKDYEQNVKKLHADMEQQKQEFDKNIQNLNDDIAARDLRQRDLIAAEKLTLLKQLYDTAAADSDKVAIVPSLQPNLRLLDTMEKLRQEIEANNKPKQPINSKPPVSVGNP